MSLLNFETGQDVLWDGWPAVVINAAHGTVWIRTSDGQDRIVPAGVLKAAQPERRKAK